MSVRKPRTKKAVEADRLRAQMARDPVFRAEIMQAEQDTMEAMRREVVGERGPTSDMLEAHIKKLDPDFELEEVTIDRPLSLLEDSAAKSGS